MQGPTGQFNAAGAALLGNVSPYSTDPSTSSEMAYLNIQHSVTKIVPKLRNIPEPVCGDGTFNLSHAVSYGGLSLIHISEPTRPRLI
eukprot:2928498-Rhodomonas_salina.1